MLVYIPPQVCEIIGDRERPSLHGWFHGLRSSDKIEKRSAIPLPLSDPVHVEVSIS